MASDAAGKYVPEESEDPSTNRMNPEVGRSYIRKIHQHPILSVEWLALGDTLRQLRRLVHLEGKAPANSKVADTAGRDKESGGTLWDQQQSENAIRILVEEAKVNLCLRIISDYKRWQFESPAERRLGVEVQQAAASLGCSESQLLQRCDQFEESLGLLLWRAFNHVETLQLMDVPLLIEHCVLVLAHCNQHGVPKPLDPKLQETVVLHYFASLMKHSEALNSSELLARSREMNLVRLAASIVLANAEEYPMEVVTSVAEGFSALADNEDFKTQWQDFFLDANGHSDVEFKKAFLTMEGKVVNLVLKESPERKKDLRPLLDFFNTVKRSIPA